MLSKDQASAAADELLAQERRAAAEQRNSRAGRVPFFLRTADSSHLERWQEWELYRLAQRRVMSGWKIVAGFIAYLMLLGGSWFLFADHPIGEWRAFALLVAVIAPTILRLVLVRRELSRLARNHADIQE